MKDYLRALWKLLGSMRFAVTILMVVAIAASIGSIVPQNAGMADYVSRYGTAGAEALLWLGLTDVYHTPWFATLLIVMATSTGICVARNLLPMLLQIRDPLDHVNRRFVEGLPARFVLPSQHHVNWQLERLMPRLRRARYRTVVRRHPDGSLLVAARRGGARRIGYLLTHMAIVLITVAAFLNSDIALRARMAMGWQRVETRTLAVDDVPPASVLPTDTWSFRGQVTLAEGDAGNHAIVAMADGYLVQPLPFVLRLLRFRVERYPNGQPRDFVSQVEVVRAGQAATRHVLRVNHPLTIDGVTLYQSGFADGGSALTLTALARNGTATPLRATVGGSEAILLGDAPWTFEATDLRTENIQGSDAPATSALARFLRGHAVESTDLGPSIAYRLRDPAGQARDMMTYLRPMTFDGVRYRVGGVRRERDDERGNEASFDYVRIPLDPDDTATTFTRFEDLLHREDARVEAARATFTDRATAALAARALATFAEDGMRGVSTLVAETVPEPGREDATALLLALIARTTPALARMGADADPARIGRLLTAHDDVMTAGTPLWIVDGTFTQRQASGLQVARQGGNALLVLSMLMLAVGVCLQYLVRERRVWLHWPADRGDGAGAAVAGMRAQRRSPALDAMLADELRTLLGPLLSPIVDASPASAPHAPPHPAVNTRE